MKMTLSARARPDASPAPHEHAAHLLAFRGNVLTETPLQRNEQIRPQSGTLSTATVTAFSD
jgi:hypothetical protein